jgi:pimeloyl-ACP methyl ester carboxylesterase
MPPRRRRAEAPARRWPILVLLALGVVAGVLLWAYTPSLPPDTLIQRYTNSHSTFIDVGGARAHVRDEGVRTIGDHDAVPIILIHGSLGSLQVWEGWVAALKGRARLISVDLPGHGLTGAWPRDEYTIEAYADFIEVLADALNLDRFAIAGHSMGGAVAWTFAATRPERVSHLILVDSAGFPGEGRPLVTRLTRLPVIGDLGIWFKPEFLVRRTLLDAYGDPAQATPERVRRYAELQRFPGNRHATLMRARTQDPLDTTVLTRLDVPTLILWGARDRWTPPAQAFRFQQNIHGARLAIFEKLGHMPMEEDAKATAAAVDAFLPATLAKPEPPPAPAPTTVPPADVSQPDQTPAPSVDNEQQQQQQQQQQPPAQQEQTPQEQRQTVAPAATPGKE